MSIHRPALSFVMGLLTFASTLQAAPRLKAGSVIYGVVPPLFGEFKLRSVTSRLDELDRLGVDVLWIAPINETNDLSHISYAPTDFEKIRSDFGTEADFRELVAEAHARGMKVILDFVANHTSNEHAWFTDAESRGPRSHTWDFYQRDDEGRPVHYFDWKHLPNVNFDNAEVSTRIVQAMEFWLERFGIDGFRYDAAWGVQERAPHFWKVALAKLRARHPKMIALAEAGTKDPAYRNSGFDLAYDWTKQVGRWNWSKAFEETPHVASHLRRALSVPLHELASTVHFLNNNDTGERFITRHGLALTKVATVLTFTVPGVPILFTGDEVGAEYLPYEDVPPLDWTDRRGLLAFHRKLIELRESNGALHSGDFQMLKTPGSEQVFTFVRRKGEELNWVILNFGSARSASIEIPVELRDSITKRQWRDELTHRSFPLRESGRIHVDVQLPAHSSYVLSPL